MVKFLSALGIWIICLLAPLLAIPWMLVTVFSGSTRFWRFAKAFDRLGNVVCGGSDREYLSAHASRARREKRMWGCVLCKLLDAIDNDHCNRSEARENLTYN